MLIILLFFNEKHCLNYSIVILILWLQYKVTQYKYLPQVCRLNYVVLDDELIDLVD